MFEDDCINVLGHRYRRVTDLNTTIGVGDVVQFCPPLDRDAEWYMFQYIAGHRVMVLINWLGFKAGLENVQALVTSDAFETGTRNVKLAWFKENWDTRFIGENSFDTTRFYKFAL